MKATAVAPSNIAFIKYWGRKDEKLRLPENGSISMNLSELSTTTTVSFDTNLTTDEIVINNTSDKAESDRVTEHLDRVRNLAGIKTHAKVVSKTNFPIGTGLSSSASGFAALTVAATHAAGLRLSEKELSILARQGSGSACRSIPDGYVEWRDGDTSESSYAVSIHPATHWDIVDVVAIVSTERKEVTTSEGQKLTGTSPFFNLRKQAMAQKLITVKKALEKKDFTMLGEITEAEALNMHAIMLTSSPALIYWTTGTLMIMKLVQTWRKEGLEVYFTINTGQDIHLIIQRKDFPALKKKLETLAFIKTVIVNSPSEGARVITEDLF